MALMTPIRDTLDDVKYRFYDIMDRMRYHTTGEQPREYLEDLHFYSQDLEIELMRTLANEIDSKMRESMDMSHMLTVAKDTGLITPVEYKLILPKARVPAHKQFITEITPEDLKRWKLDSST